MTPCQQHTGQAGAVLVVSLLVLLIMGIIATTVARTNQLQLHMAANDEARVAGMQQALAIVDAVFARSMNFSVSSPAGHRSCLG
jgi:Tfp pilus assembly protein PilX